MFVSILIPVKKDNKYLRECIENCLKLEYPDFEIIVLPDESINLNYGNKVRVIPTGKVGPAKKRDIVVDKVKGEILAFLDDDAYPRKDWLKNAIRHFSAEDVGGVCGPAVTPDSDTLLQKASGNIYGSFLVSGPHKRRYAPTQQCGVDDYPSCNFLVRKNIFEQVGGFDTRFWPGEDTILCLKITKELKKKIIYDPNVLVYHHRRPLFIPHLRQIKSYALHRGYFVKRFPHTSFKLTYFIPSIFVLWLMGGAVISIFNPAVKFFYFAVIVIYIALAALTLLRGPRLLRCRGSIYRAPLGSDKSDPYKALLAMTAKLSVLVFFGIIFTHLTYGVYFIKGLFLKRLAEE